MEPNFTGTFANIIAEQWAQSLVLQMILLGHRNTPVGTALSESLDMLIAHHATANAEENDLSALIAAQLEGFKAILR